MTVWLTIGLGKLLVFLSFLCSWSTVEADGRPQVKRPRMLRLGSASAICYQVLDFHDVFLYDDGEPVITTMMRTEYPWKNARWWGVHKPVRNHDNYVITPCLQKCSEKSQCNTNLNVLRLCCNKWRGIKTGHSEKPNFLCVLLLYTWSHIRSFFLRKVDFTHVCLFVS